LVNFETRNKKKEHYLVDYFIIY